MGEDRVGERLDVVGEGVVAPAHERSGLGRPQQHQAGARRGAELEPLVLAGVPHQRDDVVAQGLGRVDAVRHLDGVDDLGAVGDRLEVQHAVARLVAEQHAGLGVGVRIAEREPDHEAVDLRLGQRVGALVLDGVLRREDQERAREFVRGGVHGDVALLHALEQAGLRLRRGAVDLVHEHDVGEDRARAELEARLALVVDLRADDVGGQQVGRALHARELAVDRARERARQSGLADAGIVLDEDVALGEHRHRELLEHLVAHLDGAPYVLRDPARDGYRSVDLSLREPLGGGLLQGFHSASNLYVV